MEWCKHGTGQLHLGDFNGDGRQDMLCHDIKSGHKWVAFANQFRDYSGTNWQKAMKWCRHKSARLFIGDFNGDGRSDMLCHNTRSGYKWIALANRDGHFDSTNWHYPMKWCNHAGAEVHIGDFNGDCRFDLMCHDNRRGTKWIALAKPGQYLGFTCMR